MNHTEHVAKERIRVGHVEAEKRNFTMRIVSEKLDRLKRIVQTKCPVSLSQILCLYQAF